MQFHKVNTAYSLFGKQYGYKDPNKFYEDVRREHCDIQISKASPHFFFIDHINIRSLTLEACWYKLYMPYYKVWPGVFDTFIKTRLDIKAELLKFPHIAFSIKLPKMAEPLLSFDFNGYIAVIESIMVFGGAKELEIDGKCQIDIRAIYTTDNPEYPYPGHFHKTIMMNNEETIEKGIEIRGLYGEANSGRQYHIPSDIIDACVRLTVATMFLATGSHKVLEYDVLSKHLAAYRKMRGEDEKQAKAYERKARDKGKFGWNIGSGRSDRGLKLPNGVSYEKACKDAGGRELLYQHVRGGHWHSYRYGAGRKDVKIVWQEEITIRKDLLPKPLDV